MDTDKQFYFFLQTIYKAWKLNYNGSLDVVKLNTGFHIIAAIATITVIAAIGEKKKGSDGSDHNDDIETTFQRSLRWNFFYLSDRWILK